MIMHCNKISLTSTIHNYCTYHIPHNKYKSTPSSRRLVQYTNLMLKSVLVAFIEQHTHIIFLDGLTRIENEMKFLDLILLPQITIHSITHTLRTYLCAKSKVFHPMHLKVSHHNILLRTTDFVI